MKKEKGNIQLCNIIRENLSFLKNKNCCLLDIPNHVNVGDLLIWQGELEFLKRIGINLKYSCSKEFFNEKRIRKRDILLLHGGGNFGDLWEKHQMFREEIISKFKENKIILLPQTVYFKNPKNILRCVTIFSSHPDLTLCARDKKSYIFLKNNFKENKIIMIPDMAFCIAPNNYKYKLNGKVLYINRKDKEYLIKRNLSFIKYLEIKDWPTIKQGLLLNLPLICNAFFDKIKWKVSFKLNINLEDKFYIFKNRRKLINKGINFINKYDLIITDRLHGAILSLLLNKKVILLNNSYGKNKNFYDTWLKSSNCFFANNGGEVKQLITKHFSELLKNE